MSATRHELHYGDRVMRCFPERPANVDALLKAAAARNPQGVALVLGSTRVSYAELDGVVEVVAGNLAARGFAAGDRLALLIGNRLEFAYVVLAAARLGVIAVPLNPRQRRPETEFMLNQSGAKGMIFDAALAEHIPPVDATPALEQRYMLGDESFTTLLRPARAPARAVAEEDVFCLVYTSGTTGRPKGAVLTHLGVLHAAMQYEAGMALGAGEVSLLAVPITHVTGLLANFLTMLRVAGTTVFLPEFKARGFLETAERERVTHTVIVPAMYNLCLLQPDFARFDLSAWRIGGFGGAPMPEATIARLAAQLPALKLVNIYGSTETTGPVTLLPLGDVARHPYSVGKALHCADILIVDEAGREVPAGTAGELWVAGPMVVPGYWDNAEATRTGFAGGYWRSGDIGSVDADGYLRIFDRKKDMINRAGYKVYCIEVENVLSHHPGVVECAVVGRPDPVLGERVHAFVVPRGVAPDSAELRGFCAERLSDYKVPETFIFLDSPLPRNAAGKLLKSALREAMLAAEARRP
jgi:acyl-CoA synthetase (AMP-forming)/AMP-acid ligase II